MTQPATGSPAAKRKIEDIKIEDMSKEQLVRRRSRVESEHEEARRKAHACGEELAAIDARMTELGDT